MKARINAVSEVDGGGFFEVQYEIRDNKQVLYPSLTATGRSKGEVEEVIKGKITEIQTAQDEAKQLKVGDEITL